MGKSVVSVVLRSLALMGFMVPAIVVFLSFQKIRSPSDNHAVVFVVRYFYWKGFTFNSTVNCIACLYHLLVLLIPSGSRLWKTVIVLDVVMIVAVSGSVGAGWMTLLMINEGDVYTNWWPVCGAFSSFCGEMLAALIVSSFAFVVALLLIVWTLHVSVDPFLVEE